MRPPVAFVLFAVVATFLAIAHEAPEAHAHQHVRNGGFESGLGGWSVAPATDAAATTEVAAPEGTTSARIRVGESDAIIRQRLSGALAAGTYELRLAARSADGVRLTLSVLLADTLQQLVVVSEDAESDWSDASGTFTLYESREAIVSIVASGSTGAAVYIDDVRLEGAPPITITPTSTPAPLTSTPQAAGAALTATAAPSASPLATAAPAIVDVVGPDVRNGSFEDVDAAGSPFAWEKYGGVLSSDGIAHKGARAARLDSTTAATKWLHQAVTVEGGHWYQLDAWLVQSDPGVAAAFLRVSWYASADASGEALSTDDSTARLESRANAYRSLTTGAVQSPPDARSARVRIMLAPASDAPASILVDDVTWSGVAPAAPTGTATAAANPTQVDDDERTSASTRDGARGGSLRATQRIAPLVGATGASTRDTRIVINEILYDADVVPDMRGEWIEIYNAGNEPLDVSAWSLSDAARASVLPPLIVPAQGFAIIAASDAFVDAFPNVNAPVALLSGRIGNGLGNDGDRVVLADATGAVVDAVSWGDDRSVLDPSVADVPEGHSIERRIIGVDSDSAADWIDNERPSPGAPYPTVRASAEPGITGSTTVEILDGAAARDWDWVAWALLAASVAACAVVATWRGATAFRDRLRHS